MQNIYILIAIITLAIVFVLILFKWKKGGTKPLSRLASLAFVFIMGGLIFSEDQIISYSFLGLGTLFAIIDIVINLKKG